MNQLNDDPKTKLPFVSGRKVFDCSCDVSAVD